MWLRCKWAWVNLGGGPSTEVGPGVLNISEHKLTLWCFLMRDSQAWLYGVQDPCSFISFFDSRLKSVSMFFLDSHGQSMSKCQRGAAALLPFQHRETHVFPFHAHALFIQRSNVCIAYREWHTWPCLAPESDLVLGTHACMPPSPKTKGSLTPSNAFSASFSVSDSW